MQGHSRVGLFTGALQPHCFAAPARAQPVSCNARRLCSLGFDAGCAAGQLHGCPWRPHWPGQPGHLPDVRL